MRRMASEAGDNLPRLFENATTTKADASTWI